MYVLGLNFGLTPAFERYMFGNKSQQTMCRKHTI